MSNHDTETKEEYILKKVIGARRLHKLGNSLVVVIPVNFLTVYGERIDGSYWVTVNQDSNKLIIEPITNANVLQFKDMVSTPEEGKI